MIQKQFHFISGLPRSGSTVLGAILNQNPEVYVTPTSPMLDQLIENQNIWHNLQTVKANPIPVQLDNVTRGLIDAMWKHRPETVILDKNRGWGKNMPAAEILFGQKMKMVCVVRDLPSIMASWLVLLRNNPGSYMDIKLRENGLEVNDINRMEEMWENMVRDCFDAVACAVRDAKKQVLLVWYDDLVEKPEYELEKIGNFLRLPKYNYNINSITNESNDDDLSAWGLNGMHRIRGRLEKISKNPREILGEELYRKFQSIDDKFWYELNRE